MATVVRPLAQVYQRPFDIAPYGVILKPSDDAQQRGLARPVRPEHDPALVASDLPVDAAQHRRPVVHEGDIGAPQRRGHAANLAGRP